MEDALDQVQRAQHLANLAVPALGDVAMVDMVTPGGTIERMASVSTGTKVADVFANLRATTPIDPRGPHPVAEVIRTGRTINFDPNTRQMVGDREALTYWSREYRNGWVPQV